MAFDFFSLAVVTVVAFTGAALAGKLRQSVILGYLVAGVLLGELNRSYIAPTMGTDLVASPTVTSLADLGIAFLLFFVGLEFSVRKLKSAGKSSTVLALVDYATLIFAGFLLGAAFGWSPTDSLFLAGIIAMSSLGIAAKTLVDLKRLTRPETEVLLGSMVVENFLSMLLLTISLGYVVGRGSPYEIMQSVQGAAVIYGGFLALALFAMPRVARLIERVRNEEVFVLLALTLIFASAGLAISFGTPFVLGTFFIGMAFSETKLTERLQLKLSTFRDAFVAIFFVHFAMNIDFAILPSVLPLVLAAVGTVLVAEVLVLSSFGVLIGFRGGEAMAIGTATCGRGEDAIIYASLGSNLTRVEAGVTAPALAHSRELFPIAGGLALVTASLTPVLVRHSAGIARALARATPRSLAFGGRIVGAVFADSLGPRARRHDISRSDPLLLLLSVAFIAVLLPLAFSTGGLHSTLLPFGLLLALLIWREVRVDLGEVVPRVDFADLRFLVHDFGAVARYASGVVGILLLLAVLVAYTFAFSWQASVLCAVAALGAITVASARFHRSVLRPPSRMLAADLLSGTPRERGSRRAGERRAVQRRSLEDL
ncbi:MAG TPA: cation:proton antiporter [Candidatus Thermoplasmatota archaeon]